MIVKSVHGPVDISKPLNVVRGMVFERDGRRFVATRDGQYCFTGQTEHRFIGLDMREASAADVERLCCMEPASDDAAADNRARHPGFIPPPWPQCTLAIGDHDRHEDIAAGVKWAAREPQRPGVTWTYPDAGAVVGVDRAPTPTLRALLREFEGQPREHDRHARGVRVLAYVHDNAAARDLAKHLQSLGGTWHPGARRVQWPGGSSLYIVGRDDENRVRGMRVDAIVGDWPYYESARATLGPDPWGLRLEISGADAPAFWGEERRRYSGNVRSADTSRLAGYLEEVGFVDSAMLAAVMGDWPKGRMVMAGTPWRKSPGLLYADSVGGVPIGGARADLIEVDEVPVPTFAALRDACKVSRPSRWAFVDGSRAGVRVIMFVASDAVGRNVRARLAAAGAVVDGAVLKWPDWSTVRIVTRDAPGMRADVVIGSDRGKPVQWMFSDPWALGVVVPGDQWETFFGIGAAVVEALAPPIDPRRTTWLDGVTRRMLDARKAAPLKFAREFSCVWEGAEHSAEALLLSKALRAALADVDRLPWDLADRKPLRAAAHALCEMAEALTDGMGHDGPKLRPMLGEMLGILRASEHLPPATAASMAERTLGAARKAMPGRRGPRTYDHVHVYLNGKLLEESK